jgi:hypothetical protein
MIRATHRVVRLLVILGIVTLWGCVGINPPQSYADSLHQGDNTLTLGQASNGVLDDTTFREIYVFNGEANQVVAFTMTRLSGDLDTYLLFTDDQGRVLALSDDSGPGTDAAIPFQRIPSTGRYFVIATRFGQEHGVTTGEYALLAEQVGANTAADSDTVLQYGQSAIGRITNDNPLAFFFVRVQRGDVISIIMRRTSGDLDPQLDLATSDGTVLATNDDDPTAEGTLDAGLLNYTIFDSGIYLIVATRFGREAGDTEGSYVLSITSTPPDELGITPLNARLIDYGMTLDGSISDGINARYFWFQARRGDVITVTLTQETGNLDPLLTLANSDLLTLAQDDDSGDNRDARIAAFTIPITGTYYLVATRHGEQNGQTDGDFTLELNGRPGVVGGQALEIIYGATVSGQIDSQNVAEEYVFFGQAGDVIAIDMERASGDLDALITLYDSDRKQIAFDDDSGGGEKDARIQGFVLPRDDMYSLVASRFEREQGTTSGAYILTLELVRSGN